MEEKKMNFKLCDICKSQATLFCSDCECVCNYYCDSCYKFVHDKKININHKKEKIDFFIPIETKCPVHQKVDYNLFLLSSKSLLENSIDIFSLFNDSSSFILINL